MKKSVTPFPNRIALAQFRERWPKDASGMRARTLILEYLGTLFVDTALGNTALAERAQAEAGVGKLIAKILEDVRAITADKGKAKPITASKPLHRFEAGKAEQPKPEKK